MDLRPYQVDAIERVREELRKGAKRVLLIAPTGSGKTVMFSDIAKRVVAKGSRALILAHRRELVGQASAKLTAFGVPHGIVQAGFRPALHRPVQVASVPTLISRPTAVERANLVIIDEAHHYTTKNSYQRVLDRFPGAVVIGVTATPWRLDGKGLGDVFQHHVIASTPRELRDLGFLVGVGGWEYEPIDTSRARVEGGDFVAADLQASATSRRVVGDIVTEWLAHAGNARSVLFATSVEHSQMMVAEFQKAGVAAEHVDGKMATADRDGVLARLRSGQTRVVSNCNVLTEGFDCPELEVCILARPTLSTALYLQMVGRVLRPAEGKTRARIHDHAGCLATHGHPYMERDYSPQLSCKGDREAAEKPMPADKRCRSCKSVIARWPCDACGFSPTPKELQLEYDRAAAKREITNDGSAPAPSKKAEDAERQEVWRTQFAFNEERQRRFFGRMVEKHGVEKAQRIYAWFSGWLARVPPEWVQEARKLELQKIRAQLGSTG